MVGEESAWARARARRPKNGRGGKTWRVVVSVSVVVVENGQWSRVDDEMELGDWEDLVVRRRRRIWW